MGQYSDDVHNLFVELAREEQAHVTGIQTYLGMALYLITGTATAIRASAVRCPCMLAMSILIE